MAATNHSQQIKKDSRDYITTALLQLLATKNLNELSISKVVARAGVSRMAFYRNFDTLEEVLSEYFRPMITDRFTEIMKKVPAEQKLDSLSDFFESLSETLQQAAMHGYEGIIQAIFDENMLHFYQALLADVPMSATRKTYYARFMSAGIYTIWRDWLIGGQQESLNEIHDLIADLQDGTLGKMTE